MADAPHGPSTGRFIYRMIPNILTMLALCAGLTALRFGFDEKWEAAVACVAIAAILDSLDGRVARLLGQTSKFGAEFDSLSDFFAFGVAPAMLIYLWALHDGGGSLGWVAALIYSVCMALRLARFNTALEAVDPPKWTKNFFTGVPAPAAAGLALIPMIVSFQTDIVLVRHPAVATAVLIVVAGLMVSRLPTYSFKNVHLTNRLAVFALIVTVAIVAALAIAAPWLTMTLLLGTYILLLPFGWHSFRRLKRQAGSFAYGDAGPGHR